LIAVSPGRDFAARPGDLDAWAQASEASSVWSAAAKFSARMTIDVAPVLHGRIKAAAFRRRLTLADTLRDLLGRASPDDNGSAP
jgi:hypothetical protein